MYPSVEVEEEVERERERDRVSLLAALTEQGLNPPHPDSPQEPFTPEFAQAVHVYLARSKTALVALQIEDLLGMVDPVNVPSTNHEYPNWQRKLAVPVDALPAHPIFAAIVRALREERPRKGGTR